MTAQSGRPGVKRVGHKGADLIVPGNTPASFDAALAAGVDMIEFDVLPVDLHEPDTTELVLAHDYSHDLAGAPRLREGLEHLASPPFAGVELDVDLKAPGYEHRVVAALREFGLVERALVSSQFMRSLVAIRRLEPRIRLGWSIPRARRDYTQSRLYMLPAMAMLFWLQRHVPGRATFHLGQRRVDAVMAHWRLVTPGLLKAIDTAGGELYVWTVDDRAMIRRLSAMGVTGIITNDPRLFDAQGA